MSLLNSVFDVVNGWPNGSALQFNFKQKAGVSPNIGEGTVVHVENETGVPVIARHTSAAHASGNLDSPWLVVRGLDSTDGSMSQKLTCAKLRTGVMFRVPTTEYPLPGEMVYANAGALTIVNPGTAPALGRVVEFNATEGWMVIES